MSSRPGPNVSRPPTSVRTTPISLSRILLAGERVGVQDDHVGELAELQRPLAVLLERDERTGPGG